MLRVFGSREKDIWELLGYAVRQVYGISVLPEVARLPNGKPWFPSASHICFNLSHSGTFRLCAVGNRAVGVDVETVRPRRANLPRFALSPGEYEAFLRDGGTWEAFYTLWTRKEAWCKFTGSGISAHPSVISVPRDVFLRSYAGEGWRCAVCAMEPPPARVEWTE